MKVNVEVGCTPEEARAFFGLPDIKPMQDRIMGEIEERLRSSQVLNTVSGFMAPRLERRCSRCSRPSGRNSPTSRQVRRNETAMSEREKASDPKPYYEAHVFCCTNRRPAGHPRGCCAEKGSEALRDYMKGRAKDLGLKNVRINSAGCLDRCELGPTVVIYPEGVWYSCPTKEDIDEVLETHLVKGDRVERLMLQTADKLPKHRVKA